MSIDLAELIRWPSPVNGTIYELKPNNPRQIAEGNKQLLEYLNEIKTMPNFGGINWKTVLDLY